MKKILVVDDTKNIRTLLGIYLKVNGFEVLMATNGGEALSIIDTQPENRLLPAASHLQHDQFLKSFHPVR